MNQEYANLFQDILKNYHEVMFQKYPIDFKKILEEVQQYAPYLPNQSSAVYPLYGITHSDILKWIRYFRDICFKEYKSKMELYDSFEDYMNQTQIAKMPTITKIIIEKYHQMNDKKD